MTLLSNESPLNEYPDQLERSRRVDTVSTDHRLLEWFSTNDISLIRCFNTKPRQVELPCSWLYKNRPCTVMRQTRESSGRASKLTALALFDFQFFGPVLFLFSFFFFKN